MMESAIPPHLQTARSRHKRVGDDYQPPYPSFVARYKPAVGRVVMAYFGVQYRGATHAAATEALTRIAPRLTATDGPSHCRASEVAAHAYLIEGDQLMPIQIIVPEGALTPVAEAETFRKLTELLLRLHGLTGNRFMTPNVIGEVTVVPRGRTFSGGEPADIAVFELKVPSFVLPTQELKDAWI